MQAAHHSSKQFADVVYGYSTIPGECIKIMDTVAFQRLRNLKQLSMVHRVYPSAVHTRFEHSIGTCHLGGQVIDNIASNHPELEVTDREKLLVRIAGLCHDIGHGPFSHAFDRVANAVIDPSYGRFHHEQAGCSILENLVFADSDIDLDTEETRKILTMINPKEEDARSERGFLYQIISNPICGFDVDKLDYIARDCHYTKITPSISPDRLIPSRVFNGNIAIRDKDAGNLIKFFNTRSDLHANVYQHHVSKGIEMMVTEAIVLSNELLDIKGSVEDMLTGDPSRYMDLDDNVLTTIRWANRGPGGVLEQVYMARNLIERIDKRNLYTMCGEKTQMIKVYDKVKVWNKPVTSSDVLRASHMKHGSFNSSFQLEETDFVMDSFVLGWGGSTSKTLDNFTFYDKYDNNASPFTEGGRHTTFKLKAIEHHVQRVYAKSHSGYNIVKEAFTKACSDDGTTN